jgi:HSP20 family protein
MLWQIERDPFVKLRGAGSPGLERDLNHLFRVGFGPGVSKRAEVTGSQVSAKREDGPGWMPSVDISENEQAIVLEADLPGLSAGDFKLSVDNQILTLSGERRRPQVPQEPQGVEGAGASHFQRVERKYGSFRRSFTLPPTVSIERVAADYRDGVLRVTMPKREETRPRQIEVSVRTESGITS